MTHKPSHSGIDAVSLVEVVRRRAAQRPEVRSFSFEADDGEQTHLTYAELDLRARAIAARLQFLGAARALLVYPPGLEYVVAVFGCLYAGTAAVPVYPPRSNRHASRVLAILEDATADTVLTTSRVASTLEPLGGRTWAATDDIPAETAEAWTDPRAGEQTLALIQYTSGSTASPKGVRLTHGNLLHNLGLIQDTFSLGPETRAVIWLPPYHDMGLIGGILQPLYAGFPALLMSPITFLRNPFRWLQAISETRATTSGGPNFAFELCLRKIAPEQRATLDLSTWSVAFNGAEPVRADTLDRFARTFEPCGFRREAFFPCYGLAEATLMVTAGSLSPAVEWFDAEALGRHEARAAEPGSGRALVGCGRVAGEQKIGIVDPESARQLSGGQIGEIWISGPSVTGGYWNRPEETERTCRARLDTGEGPFLRTGDLGFLKDGRLFITGRIKDLIVVRGRNHYPQDIELTVERSHPALRPGGAAAFAVDVEGEERLVVVQEVLREQRNVDVTAVAQAIRTAVADEHEVQVHAAVVVAPGGVPKTSSGKIQRHACRAAYLQRTLPVVAEWREEDSPEAPAEEGESFDRPAALARWLALQVAARLRIQPHTIDLDQSVTCYALDSLNAVELAHAIEEKFGVALPLEKIFAAKSLRQLAQEIGARRDQRVPGDTPLTEAPPSASGPLSPGQSALWFLHRLEPDSPAYNVPAAVRILGELDVPALRRAFQGLVGRHPSLRATFTTVQGEPTLVINEAAEIRFQEEDVRTWTEQALRALLATEAHRPFDLERGPLVRVALWRRTPAEHVLLLTMHHIVTDFWSQAVLLRDLGALYAAERTGANPDLPPLGLTYADYARWQEDMLAGPEGERLRAYWRERLAGELPVLDLHTDRPRPAVQTYRGAAHPISLDGELLRGLKGLGRRLDATLFMMLLAAFQALLARHAGQQEVVVGAPVSGRGRARLGGLVGYFVNPVALRADLSGDPTFADFLKQVRQTVLGAFEHQDYPFPHVVEKLRPGRDPSRTPIFQAMLALQNAPAYEEQSLTGFALGEAGARIRWQGLTLESVPLEERIAQFDLTLNLGEVDGALRGSLNYNSDLFEPETVAAMARRFEILLRGIVASPETRISELPLLPESEAHRQLVEWNATTEEYPCQACVHDLIEAQGRRTPEAPAAIFRGRTVSYGELWRRAKRVAAQLRPVGVGPETLVGIYLESSLDMMVAILGVLKAGGAYLPLDPASPRERLAYITRDARVRVIVTEERLRPSLEGGAPLLCLDLEGDGPPEEPAATTPRAENLACVLYTSGSTGEPKGVLLTHRSIVNLITSFLRSYDAGPADRILPLTSIASASFVGEILPLLCAGGAVVLPDRIEALDLPRLSGLMAAHGVSIVSTVPARVRTLKAARLPRLRLLLSGGEALTAADVGTLLDSVALVNGYGLTEATICSTYHRVQRDDLASPASVPIGKPVMNTQIYVLDRGLRGVPVGTRGELYVAGDGLARCYLDRPDLTAERFLPNPFRDGQRLYRTGDLAAWRPNGSLEFLGRSDHQIKVRGFRIDLDEVEVVLHRHPAVRECAVVASDDVPGEKRLVAYVVAENGASPRLTAGTLLAYLREKLPSHMVPSAYQFLDALPRTATGKVDERALPAPEAARPELETAFAAPRSEMEQAIAGIWRDLLRLDSVGIQDNFFDLGGHSLLLARVQSRIREVLGKDLSMVDLLRYPTVSALSKHLSPEEDELETGTLETAQARRPTAAESRDIAVIAVSGRFPGARNPDQLWENVRRGVESITLFTDEELEAAGISPALVKNPDYIKAKGVLGDIDLFDAHFFGLSPREVELMDPQHRLLLECAWEALERAGYNTDTYAGRIGVYAGQSMNTYLLINLLPGMELVASVDTLQVSLGNDKDPLTGRISYKLNLKGPSITIQSASSTSLVAVHVARQSLLDHECDIALAGGVSVHLPEKSGYLYHEGGTTSRDGHCRAFDARADGFVSGNGVGLVVLKRLEEALRDRDNVLAIIKGSACNNDGSQKVSFMAPSVEGQVELYTMAHAMAGVSPDSIGYIECHGTGTALGDPIEVEALSLAFRARTSRKGFCALGSLKTNIGHLDTAAGVSGLIKGVLALHNKTIPASLHFTEANPQIDFDNSPFFVNTTLLPWEAAGSPRRAGVTSLGMGGTNAHVVLEEAPAPEPPAESRPWQILLLSAKTPPALENVAANLLDHLREMSEITLPDVAYTLQVGRKRFEHRRMVLCRDAAEAIAALETLDPGRVLTAHQEPGDRSLVFLFTGQGAQHVGMGRDLYEQEPPFRSEMDRCAERLSPQLGFDLRAALYPAAEATEEMAERLRQTAVAQPALFALEYALARLWMRWGARPRAMIGHSIGEYVAACLAGVLSLEDALDLVVARGRLMQSMPPGGMLAVPLSEAEMRPRLGAGLSLAAVNHPSLSVVSGPEEDIARLEAEMDGRGLACHRLHTSHAFHSAMMDPILDAFTDEVRKAELRPPRLPYISNVTGTWIRAEEATDPEYWARQLRQTVRFADGLSEVLRASGRILLEVGPGNTLCSLVQQHPGRKGQTALSSLPHQKERASAQAHLLGTLGKLWLAGASVDWSGFYENERRRRVVLPTYPFERQRYWVNPGSAERQRKEAAGKRPIAEWFYAPIWKQVPRPTAAGALLPAQKSPWLIFADELGLGAGLAERLRREGHDVVTVAPDPGFEERQYDQLLSTTPKPRTILHLWSVTDGGRQALSVQERLDRGFLSLLRLARSIGRQGLVEDVQLWVLSNDMQDVTGEEELCPEKATVLGACRVIPRENQNVSCHSLDLTLAGRARDGLVDRILREIGRPGAEPVMALRGRSTWVQTFEAVALEAVDGRPAVLREGGVYLITGGRGGIGLEIASFLARVAKARLVLVGRSAVPEREKWPTRLLELETLGAEVLPLRADVANLEQLRLARAQVRRRFGPINGIIHAAGVPAGGLIQTKTWEDVAAVLAPKVQGTLALETVFAEEGLDFLVLFSSITALIGHVGQADYAAANAFLDAFAPYHTSARGVPTLAIDWDAWQKVGMAANTPVQPELKEWREQELSKGILPHEGVEAFARMLESGLAQVVVSTQDLQPRLTPKGVLVTLSESPPRELHPRPALASDYAAPTSPLEEAIARIWQEILGIGQVGIHDNFFDLGGNSLMALRVIARLRSELALSIPDMSLFEGPTVAALARIASPAPAEAAAEDESRRRGERRRARQQRRNASVTQQI